MIVIKSLLTNITLEEVLEKLKIQGYEIISVWQLGKLEKRLPIHKVMLRITPKIKGIFQTSSMFHIKVKVERYKFNTLV